MQHASCIQCLETCNTHDLPSFTSGSGPKQACGTEWKDDMTNRLEDKLIPGLELNCAFRCKASDPVVHGWSQCGKVLQAGPIDICIGGKQARIEDKAPAC